MVLLWVFTILNLYLNKKIEKTDIISAVETIKLELTAKNKITHRKITPKIVKKILLLKEVVSRYILIDYNIDDMLTGIIFRILYSGKREEDDLYKKISKRSVEKTVQKALKKPVNKKILDTFDFEKKMLLFFCTKRDVFNKIESDSVNDVWQSVIKFGQAMNS